MSALKPYPHYEINVKDNSIYTFAIDEILPVHRPLWTLACQEGPAGEPVWCPTASYLKKKFGEQTINLANPKFASIQSFYLNQTMSYNGAFIVRALPDDAKYATAILFAKVEDAAIAQYLIDDDQTSPTYGTRLIDNDPDSDTYGQYIPSGETENGIKITYYVRPATERELKRGLDLLKPSPIEGGATVYPILAFRALYKGSYGNDLTFRLFYKESENSVANTALYKSIFNSLSIARRQYNNTTTNIIYDIFGRNYTTFAADPECADPETGVQMGMDNVITNAFDIESAEGSDFPFTVYTFEENLRIIGEQIIEAEYKGSADQGRRSLALDELNIAQAGHYETKDGAEVFVADMSGYQINVISGINLNGYPYDHVAISGRENVDNVITYSYAATTDTTYQEDKIYYKECYVVDSAGHETTVKKYVKLIEGEDYVAGDAIVVASSGEGDDAVSVPTIYLPMDADADLQKAYPVVERTATDHSTKYDEQDERVILDQDIDIFLTGGSDGLLEGASEKERDDFVDHYFYDFLKLHINPKIVDKFRYPITHLYDPGYSMTTKYAMLDFLDTRDDVAVELSTQVLFPSKWATGYERDIKLNDQAKDLQDGMVLRERAMLMRESVLKGTECMRASIYTQAGKPVAATWTKPVPFSFWSAMQHAKYGNTDQMSVQEPRGLPYSYNEMFKTWNWTNYSELLKEKTWNAGLNYCQYADMTRIFYPALRTVYREETSVLTDQWVVDALVYTKHECRKAWARFSGRNDRQEVLETAIKVYLEGVLSYLYNGKYDFELSVYKTEEEKKLGYIEHVKLRLVFPATMRVINFDIEVNREGYNPESEG